MELSVEQARRLLVAAGAEDVADDAAAELARTLETYAGHVSEEAVAQALEEGNGVVTQKHIIAAEE